MGASTSVSTQSVTKTVKNNIDNNCKAKINSSQNISGINIDNSYGCPIEIINEDVATADCQLNNTVELMSQLAVDNKAIAETGFGFSTSVATQTLRNQIENSIRNQCTAQADIDQNISNILITNKGQSGDKCGAIKIMNRSDQKVNCALGVWAKATDKAGVTQSGEAKGFGLTAIGGLVLIICLCVCISLCGWLFTRGGGDSGGSGSQPVAVEKTTSVTKSTVTSGGSIGGYRYKNY